MNIQDLNRAADLVKALEEGLQTQKVVLEGLVTSLELYQEFLAQELLHAHEEAERLGNPTREEFNHV